jgi:hypothetical protein
MAAESGRPTFWDVVAMTSNYEPDLARIPLLLRDHVGVDPNDAAVILDLAAIGITNGTWRNSPLEDWHGAGRIHDGGMLRANVATTKLVRSILDDHLDDALADADEELIATEDLAALDSDFTDELFVDVFERLSNPDRVLLDGLTLGQLAGEELDELVDHMDRALGGIAASAERHGLDFALQSAAVHGGLACAHWWGTPWWPDIVVEFLARLDDPRHPHWGEAGKWYLGLPTQPAEVADRRRLRALLLDAPEALSEDGAEFCVAAGIRFVTEPVQAWRAAHGASTTS